LGTGEHRALSEPGASLPRGARRRARDRRTGGLLVALLFGLFALCYLAASSRGYAREELLRASAWCLILLGAYAGWGTALAAITRQRRVPLALSVIWGASLFTFFGGVSAAASLLSAGSLHAFIVVGGLLLAAHTLRRRRELGLRLRALWRTAPRSPPVQVALLALGVFSAIQILGGAADLASNPYDDGIAYYPFAKQLLEHGTLIEPFSFRRLGTLGGQALQHAALLLAVPLPMLNAFDRSLCLLLSLGLLASHEVEGKRPPLFARMLSALVLLSLPNISINSASHYSGLAFFLGLFQTLERLPRPPLAGRRERVASLVPLALTAAALCTLRQNYLATVGLCLCISYACVLLQRRARPRASALEAVVCFGLLGGALLPWLILSYRSSHTFLFPLLPGTFNPDVALQSHWSTFSKLLRFAWEVWMHAEPFAALSLFLLAGLSVRERSLRRPLASLWLAAVLTIALSCASLSLMDPGNLSRYCFGFLAASILLSWQCAAARFRAEPLTATVMALALLVTLERNQSQTYEMVDRRIADLAELLRRTSPAEPVPPVAAAYRRLQSFTPVGATLLVMLEEPYHLDYARNTIYSLDLPGIASPGRGMPCFQGPEALAGYLHQQGIRYLAFVRPERAAFSYRRADWFPKIFGPQEIWRVYAPYMVDVMDNVARLGESRGLLHEDAGMMLLDLDSRVENSSVEDSRNLER
jgi:hypothetical protein